jgi:hypothetical protein
MPCDRAAMRVWSSVGFHAPLEGRMDAGGGADTGIGAYCWVIGCCTGPPFV